MAVNAAERRLYTRHIRDLKTLINLDGSWEKAECTDISGGGLRFVTSSRPTINEIIEIHIDGYGRFKGMALRHVEDGFVAQFNASDFIMKQLAEELDNT